MRSLLLVMFVFASAHAEPTVPMKPVADRAEVCTVLRPDPKAKCETAGKLAVALLGNVELHVAKGTGAINYATVVEMGGKLWMSEPFAVMKSFCAAGDCEVLDDTKPSLRSVNFAGKQLAAAVIDQRFHLAHGKAVAERWTATTLIACGAPAATPACTTRTWGARGISCTVDVQPVGDVVAKCTEDPGGAPRSTGTSGSLIDEANKAYDRGDYDAALAKANAALAKEPTNVRMLRLVVSIKCINGDAAGAQAAAKPLPATDLAQMKTRCDRQGVKL